MNNTTTPRCAVLGALAAALAIGATALSAHAQDKLIVVEQTHAATYLNGGIGTDDERSMRKMAKDWPLRMIFSEGRHNEFVADVDVLVADSHGTPYLMLSNAGPMTYAMLPAGKYRVTARFNGRTETHKVMLDGKTGQDVYIHWKGAAG